MELHVVALPLWRIRSRSCLLGENWCWHSIVFSLISFGIGKLNHRFNITSLSDTSTKSKAGHIETVALRASKAYGGVVIPAEVDVNSNFDLDEIVPKKQ